MPAGHQRMVNMHAGEYTITNFSPVTKAMELYEHVDLITNNPNKFQEYKETTKVNADGTITKIIIVRQDTLVNRIREQAYRIFILAHTANEINLGKEPHRKAERLEKQSMAIDLCEEHLASIQLCRKHFHLSNRKAKYWGRLTLSVKEYLKGWHESDKARYKNI